MNNFGYLAIGVMLCALGVVIVRRVFAAQTLADNNEFGGVAYWTIGLVYGVILGFVVVMVWERYSTAESGVGNEVVRISALWRDSNTFPDAYKKPIHQYLLNYTQAVIEHDWPAMAKTHKLSDESASTYETLWQKYYDTKIDPNDTRSVAFFSESISQLNELGMQRRLRSLEAAGHLPTDLWIFLVVGGFATVAFTYFIGIKSAWSQHLMTAAMVLAIGCSLILLQELENPFSGRLSVPSTPFVELLASLRSRQ